MTDQPQSMRVSISSTGDAAQPVAVSDASSNFPPANSRPSPLSSLPRISASSQHRSFSSSLLFNLVIPLLLIAAGIAVVIALGKDEPETLPPADTTRSGRLRSLPAVSVDRVQSLESTGATLQLRVDGTVVPFREVRIATEVAGQIIYKSPECEAGSYVRNDQVLMRIDPTDYEFEIERLTRLKEQEYQSLRELDQEEVNTQRLLELADKDLKLQERELERRRSLPSGFSSQGEIDQASRAVVAAQQQRLSFENQLDLLKKRRVRLEASERLAATQLRSAEVNLQRTEIKAPMDGVIVNEDAELNTFVARGSTIVTMDDTSKVEVATSLRMDQLHWILDQPGAAASDAMRGYDLPETPAVIEYEVAGRSGVVYRWNGRLISYSGIGVDPQTRTVPVRVLVDDPQHYLDEQGNIRETAGASALVRGMFVQVKLLIKPKTPLVVIPARALKPGNRVWQFLPDESVLETLPSDADPASEVADAAHELTVSTYPLTSEASDSPLDTFDPSAWMPGRVIVRRDIIPVDSLELDNQSNLTTVTKQLQENHLSESDDASDQHRSWVCEVRDGTIRPDSLVVVSPLGNVESDAVPARAPVPTSTSSLVATETQSKPEAKR